MYACKRRTIAHAICDLNIIKILAKYIALPFALLLPMGRVLEKIKVENR